MPFNLLLSSLLFLSFALSAGACAKESPCEAAYKKLAKCDPDAAKMVTKDKFIQACKAQKDDPRMACIEKSGCADYSLCMEELQTAERQAKLKSLVAGGKWSQARRECSSYEGQEPPPAIQALCRQAAVDELASETAKVRAALDKGQKTGCKLDLIAEQVGGAAVEEAKTLCEEVKMLYTSEHYLRQTAELRGARLGGTISQCKTHLEKLDQRDYIWAPAKSRELAKACFVTAAKDWTLERMKTYKGTCLDDHRDIAAAVEKYELQADVDKELQAAIDTQAKLCKNKGR